MISLLNRIRVLADCSWKHIRDLNYVIFAVPRMELFLEVKAYTQRSVFEKLLRYCARFLLSILRDICDLPKLQLRIAGKLVFLGHASSSRDVLSPLASLYGNDAVFIETVEEKQTEGRRLPHSLIYLLSILMLPKFVSHVLAVSAKERKLIFTFLRAILLSYGADVYWKIVLAIWKPIGFFVANDHSFETRTPVLAAHRKGIPVFYVQHAPVTRFFPPLVFDISFLEGEHSLQCYGVKASNSVVVAGNLKFETVRHLRNKNTTVKAIGIAGSSFLSMEDSIHLVEVLRQDFRELRIIFRPHPDAAHEYWSLPDNVEFSSPNKEKAFDFLSRVDLVIGGESGILSEASIMNVYPVLYGKENRELIAADTYGFIAHGVCDVAHDDEHVVQIIRKQMDRKEDSFHRASYYYSNCYKPFASDPFREIVSIVKKYVEK